MATEKTYTSQEVSKILLKAYKLLTELDRVARKAGEEYVEYDIRSLANDLEGDILEDVRTSGKSELQQQISKFNVEFFK